MLGRWGLTRQLAWTQILRAFVRVTDPLALRAQAGSGAAYLSQLVPDIRQAGETDPAPASFTLEPERDRFYLFDAVSTFLKRASAFGPLLLVLDDFHASDSSSLFVSRELRDSRILVVVTYRDVEAKARTAPGADPRRPRAGRRDASPERSAGTGCRSVDPSGFPTPRFGVFSLG